MKIYSAYSNRPPVEYKDTGGESITETAGYIPPDVQVTQMLNAGIVLQHGREGLYDSDIDDSFDDDAPLDRLDARDADMVDVHEAVVEAKERRKRAKKVVEDPEQVKHLTQPSEDHKEGPSDNDKAASAQSSEGDSIPAGE